MSKHRKPPEHKFRGVLAGIFTAVLMLVTPAAAYACPVATTTKASPAKPSVTKLLADIMKCESNNRNVRNTQGSSASGYYQITKGTWQDHGGREYAPEAIKASKAEQTVVAKRILAKRGTQPWNASKKCWG